MEIVMMNNSIRKIRKRKNVSLESIASFMSVNVSRVKSWEMNCINMNIRQIKQLARFLGVSVDTLIFGEEFEQIDISCLNEFEIQYVMKLVLDQISEDKNTNGRIERNSISQEQTDFGNSLKYVRVKIMGLIQQEFADEVGVSKETIKSWEAKAECTSLSGVISISQATGVAIDYFIFEDCPLRVSSSRINKEKYNLIQGLVNYLTRHERD